MADQYLCRDCSKIVTATRNNRYRTHTDKDGEKCPASSVEIPEDLLAQGAEDPKTPKEVPAKGKDFETCPQCGKNVKLTRLGYFQPHATTLYGSDRCQTSGVRAFHAGKAVDVELPEKPIDESVRPNGARTSSPDVVRLIGNELAVAPTASSPTVPEDALPTTGISTPTTPESPESTLLVDTDSPFIELLKKELGATVMETFLHPGSLSSEKDPPMTVSPESTTTSIGSPEWTEALDSFFLETVHAMLMDAISDSTPASQPASATPSPDADPAPGFDRLLFATSPVAGKTPVQPMGDLAKELATRIKETFYAYSNRKTKDNRSAQTTLGPSEIGTPCDRRLAMALMNIPPVNPGGDGWAAFVGTCTHVGMAEVYAFADAGTGRYAVELPVFLGMPSVPRGTTDLLDRRDGTVVDWKVMGWSSLKKFKEKGPSETYRTQAHVYGLGAEKGGEKVRNVAIVGLPRGGFSLDEMHVWTEKYDRKFAQAALDRVEKIAQRVQDTDHFGGDLMAQAKAFPVADDCAYCPFHLKGDKEMRRGCPGK